MPYRSSSAAGDGGLAQIGLRIIGAMQPSAVGAKTAECVAKHKPTSTFSGEQSNRQLSAGASRPTRRQLAFRLTRIRANESPGALRKQ
jgi:hypothetical protein